MITMNSWQNKRIESKSRQYGRQGTSIDGKGKMGTVLWGKMGREDDAKVVVSYVWRVNDKPGKTC